MRAPLLLTAALLGALCAAGCADPNCRARVDRCLQRCPPEDTLPEDAKGPHDNRDSCVRRCQQMCRW